MDKNTLEQIKTILLTEKAQLQKDLGEITHQDSANREALVDFPNYGDKPDENALEVEAYTTNLATEKVIRDAIRDIDAALERIEQGTYGVCKYCGNEIAEKRLLARPVASACVDCKSKLQNVA